MTNNFERLLIEQQLEENAAFITGMAALSKMLGPVDIPVAAKAAIMLGFFVVPILGLFAINPLSELKRRIEIYIRDYKEAKKIINPAELTQLAADVEKALNNISVGKQRFLKKMFTAYKEKMAKNPGKVEILRMKKELEYQMDKYQDIERPETRVSPSTKILRK